MTAASQYYSVTARVGVPHRHEVEVTVPLVGPAGATGPAGAAGASAWNDITGKPSTFAPSAHASSHHTGGTDPLTPANIGAAKDFTEIEVGNSGTSTTTLTTAQLPARVILFIDAATAPSATINLPTPDARQSGLVASIKVQVEGGSADTALITVVHNAVNLLSAYSLAEDEGTIDFRWDGYRWVYDANWLLRSSTGRVLELPTTSGTIARTQDFASPPAIGNTTPAAGSFTTVLAVGTNSPTNVNFAAGSPTVGIYGAAGDASLRLAAGGVQAVTCFGSGANAGMTALRSDTARFGFGGSVISPILEKEGDGILSQKVGTSAQTFRLYNTFTSSTNYQRMTVNSVRQTLSALSGASATTTGTFIPDGAVVVGVTTRVATLLTGATGYTIGDGTDADRWGDITGTAVGTTSDNRDWTAGTIECFTAGGNITLTAKTSNFTAGAIEVCVFYLAGEAD